MGRLSDPVGRQEMANLVAGKSGVTDLFDTPAMGSVDSGTAAWTEVLGTFAAQPEKRQAMRDAAASYSRDRLATWREVLAEDFYPIWRDAAETSTQKRAA